MASRAICQRGLLVHYGRSFSCTAVKNDRHFPLVVLGGGAGGCPVAARACKQLGPGKVAIVDAAKYHYNQAMWTLVGGGIKKVEQSQSLMEETLPPPCVLIKQRVEGFDPKNNSVTLNNGEKLTYDYLVIALGIQLNYNKVDGLLEALKSDPMVCSNYWRVSVVKTFPAIQRLKSGNAVFTFPNTPVKCAGAPQKIMYLADDYWRKHGVRDKLHIEYDTSLAVIFGVKKYAAVLREICKSRDLEVNYRRNLKAVDHTKREAVFDLLDSDKGETMTVKYDFLHATPPMSAPDCLRNSTSQITDETGFLDVNRETMQHVKFKNIFGLGDCTNIPTSKTAAAVACQNKVLMRGLKQAMDGKLLDGKYDGYTSCPLITGYNKCVLAEFDFNQEPLETFPIDQGKERHTMFFLKKFVMPQIYWKMLLRGHWGGPRIYRKMMHLGMTK